MMSCNNDWVKATKQSTDEAETVYSLRCGKTEGCTLLFLKDFKGSSSRQSLRRLSFEIAWLVIASHPLGVICDGRASVLDLHKANSCLAFCGSSKLWQCSEKNCCAEQSQTAANIHIQSACYINFNYAGGKIKWKWEGVSEHSVKCKIMLLHKRKLKFKLIEADTHKVILDCQHSCDGCNCLSNWLTVFVLIIVFIHFFSNCRKSITTRFARHLGLLCRYRNTDVREKKKTFL